MRSLLSISDADGKVGEIGMIRIIFAPLRPSSSVRHDCVGWNRRTKEPNSLRFCQCNGCPTRLTLKHLGIFVYARIICVGCLYLPFRIDSTNHWGDKGLFGNEVNNLLFRLLHNQIPRNPCPRLHSRLSAIHEAQDISSS